MTKRSEINIEISPNGDSISLHVQGIKGKKCVDSTEALENGLGIVASREYTREFNKQPEKEVVNIGLNRR